MRNCTSEEGRTQRTQGADARPIESRGHRLIAGRRNISIFTEIPISAGFVGSITARLKAARTPDTATSTTKNMHIPASAPPPIDTAPNVMWQGNQALSDGDGIQDTSRHPSHVRERRHPSPSFGVEPKSVEFGPSVQVANGAMGSLSLVDLIGMSHDDGDVPRMREDHLSTSVISDERGPEPKHSLVERTHYHPPNHYEAFSWQTTGKVTISN